MRSCANPGAGHLAACGQLAARSGAELTRAVSNPRPQVRIAGNHNTENRISRVMKRKIRSFCYVYAGCFINSSRAFQAAPAPEPNISVVGYFVRQAQRGRTFQTAIVIDIPNGYHINSNRPLESYLIATQLKVDAP